MAKLGSMTTIPVTLSLDALTSSQWVLRKEEMCVSEPSFVWNALTPTQSIVRDIGLSARSLEMRSFGTPALNIQPACLTFVFVVITSRKTSQRWKTPTCTRTSSARDKILKSTIINNKSSRGLTVQLYIHGKSHKGVKFHIVSRKRKSGQVDLVKSKYVTLC